LSRIENYDKSRSAHRTVLEFNRVSDPVNSQTYDYRSAFSEIPSHNNAQYQTIIHMENRPFIEMTKTGGLRLNDLIYGLITQPHNLHEITIMSNYMRELYMSLSGSQQADWTSPALSDCYCGFTLGLMMPFEKRFSYDTLIRHDFDTMRPVFAERNDPNEDSHVRTKYDRPRIDSEALDHSVKLIVHSKFNIRSSIYATDLLWLIEFQSGTIFSDYSLDFRILARQKRYAQLVHILNSLDVRFMAGIARYAFRPPQGHQQPANGFTMLSTFKRKDDFYAVRSINTARLLNGDREEVTRVRLIFGQEVSLIESPIMAHSQSEVGRVGRHMVGSAMVSQVDMNQMIMIADGPEKEDRMTRNRLIVVLTLLNPYRFEYRSSFDNR